MLIAILIDAVVFIEANSINLHETPPTAVSRPPSIFPAMVVHTFMKPPGGSAGWRICFPIPAQENGFATEKCVASMNGTEMPMACSALEY